MQCESGNGITENGKGLCQRPAEKVVQMTRSHKVVAEFNMCRGCASHWEIVSPYTMKVIGDVAAA